MIQNCNGCSQVSGETNCIDDKGEPFFLCVKCVLESESINCCDICDRPINEDHETYESTDIYLDGNYEDTVFVHTNCRYEQEQKSKKALDVIESIQIYVRMLQDGDPENENAKQILDHIEKEVDNVLVQESSK